jgi:hypothetical protein
MSEPGQPNAATLELCFWEAIKRCALDDEVPLSLVLCDGTEDTSGMTLPNPLPPQLWQYMAAAHAELRAAAGV